MMPPTYEQIRDIDPLAWIGNQLCLMMTTSSPKASTAATTAAEMSASAPSLWSTVPQYSPVQPSIHA